MNAFDDNLLNESQLRLLKSAFHQGAADASTALAKWLGKPAMISVEAVEQLPLIEATGVLGVDDQPICFCSTEMTGRLTGELILAFDDASGLALADMLLDQPAGTANEWDEMKTSAALALRAGETRSGDFGHRNAADGWGQCPEATSGLRPNSTRRNGERRGPERKTSGLYRDGRN